MKSLSEKLKQLRAKIGYDQEYMAHRLNLSQSRYSKLEHNPAHISISKLIAVAEILNVSLIELFEGTAFEKYAPDQKIAELYRVFAEQMEINKTENQQQFINNTIKAAANILSEFHIKIIEEKEMQKREIESFKYKNELITGTLKNTVQEILYLAEKFPDIKSYLKDKM